VDGVEKFGVEAESKLAKRASGTLVTGPEKPTQAINFRADTTVDVRRNFMKKNDAFS
jgi:hypothetical protein